MLRAADAAKQNTAKALLIQDNVTARRKNYALAKQAALQMVRDSPAGEALSTS